jgi:nicotinamide-nucleotide amidase
VQIHPLDRPVDAAAAESLAAAAAEEWRHYWRTSLGLAAQAATHPEADGFTTVALALAHANGVTRLVRRFDLALPEGWEFVGTAALELVRNHLQSPSDA